MITLSRFFAPKKRKKSQAEQLIVTVVVGVAGIPGPPQFWGSADAGRHKDQRSHSAGDGLSQRTLPGGRVPRRTLQRGHRTDRIRWVYYPLSRPSLFIPNKFEENLVFYSIFILRPTSSLENTRPLPVKWQGSLSRLGSPSTTHSQPRSGLCFSVYVCTLT